MVVNLATIYRLTDFRKCLGDVIHITYTPTSGLSALSSNINTMMFVSAFLWRNIWLWLCWYVLSCHCHMLPAMSRKWKPVKEQYQKWTRHHMMTVLQNIYSFFLQFIGMSHMTHCKDDKDNTWHAVGSSWRNSQCMDCDCGGCCTA